MLRPLSIAMIGLRGIPATYGGVEGAVEALSVELAARGHAVTVYGRTAYCDTRIPSHRGVELRYLPQLNTKHLEAASHTALAVGHALRERRFDIVHLHATGPALFSFLPKLSRAKCVATIHGLDWKREKWGPAASVVLRLGARIAATVPDRTIVVSKQLERDLRERYGAETAYIPNGVNLSGDEPASPVPGLDPDRFVLFLGRLVPEKGVHTLLEAFAWADVPHKLAIAGPASHSSDYVRRLEAMAGRDERVVMLGPRYGAEKAWLLRHAALFVQPSTLEGLPITLMEAAAFGSWPLVSDIPENLEVVGDGDALQAATFRAGDSQDLAARLAEALADPDRAAKGARTRELVLGRYDWGRIAAATEAEYRRALTPTQPSAAPASGRG